MPRNRNVAPVKNGAKKDAMKRLVSYVFKYYKWQFLLVSILIIISSLVGVAGSYFTGNIIVGLIDNTLKTLNQDSITDAIKATTLHSFEVELAIDTLVMGIIFLIGTAADYFYNFTMAFIGQGVQKKIRDDLYKHMQYLPVSYFDTRTKGDIMSVYTNDVDALREMLSRALPLVVLCAMQMLVCLIMMLVTDIYLTLVVLFFAFIIFTLTRIVAVKSSKNFIAQQTILGKTNGYIEEMVTGQKVVKVFNYEDRNVDGFDKLNNELYKQSVSANKLSNILMPAANQLGNILYVILCVMGALFIYYKVPTYSLVGKTTIAVPIIVSFILYSKLFIRPIGQISQNFNTIVLALAGSSRIFEMMDVKEEVDEGYVELVNATSDNKGNPIEVKERTGRWAWKHYHTEDNTVSYNWLEGKITFDHVDFGYTNDKIVLHDITLYALPGQKVAFVGPTGAGKTTITNLINRFYDIADGKIRYDDININKIKKADLRRSLGVVLQDTKLFTGTIKENIRFGNEDATDEEILKASKLAHADDFISKLPNGYDTVLENAGNGLSQGQKQLIAIARAAVSDPPVMILDEATSSIDTLTEKLVQQGMDSIMKGRTVFVIAHRLSTIKNSDVIMVLRQGSIIERGNHEQLLEEKGVYYQLYTGNQIEKKEE